ncbi:YwmB family TATA-box binding protein [Bacillus suaedaesalsae]|uniref:YwmB family TATA-box binding protein n=1 Tax=Bacillus suaedaesalsae TaxID=2810349 RepID=A0ABS2DCT6_9BACI|nr:YwmB family TATA-box binding protein [Bacillus suaedaesalsae]MBM6616269.1 YwmB family TATA-box binding protein [Bacillus suaedaesalsae]
MKLVSLLMSIVIGFQLFPTLIDESPLAEMEEVATKQEIEVSDWKVYIKVENKRVSSENEVKKELSKLMKRHDTYKWNNVEDEQENHVKYIGEKRNKSGKEQIIMTVYQYDTGYKMTVSHELTGQILTKETLDYIQATFKQELKDNHVFYSIYGSKDYDQSLNIESETNKILHAFSAKPVEEMKEEGFHSISAFHDKWDTNIPTKDGEVFNLQVGLRVDEKAGKINIAIGTPIITSGY